jgi:general stress protein 26
MTKSEILSFIDSRPILTLTTMNGARPETRALINIRNADIAPHLVRYFKHSDRIFFITNTHTDKIQQVRANGIANVYAFDDNFSGLLLMGTVNEVRDADIINTLWDDSWKIYYPDGRDGGDFSLLEFIPGQFKHYNGNGFVKTGGEIRS